MIKSITVNGNLLSDPLLPYKDGESYDVRVILTSGQHSDK